MQTFDVDKLDRDGGVPERLEIVLEPDPQGVRVRLVGEIDLGTAPELDRQLDELAVNGYSRLLIDLDGVEFMDSTGVKSILHAMHSADAKGHRLTITRGSSQVQRLLEITGVLDHVTLEEPGK